MKIYIHMKHNFSEELKNVTILYVADLQYFEQINRVIRVAVVF